MPGILPLHLVVLFWCPPDPEPVMPGITLQFDELPGGGSPVFRTPTAEAKPAPKPLVETERGSAPEVRPALPRLSSRFGRRGDPFRKTAAMHYGLDMPGRPGTPVLASASGVVRFAGSAGSYGEMVEIDHDGGLATRYAHLSRILVRPGTRVEQGQPVALMGSTGRSTGSHLHFEVRIVGRAVDPLPWLRTEATAPTKPWIAPDAPHISAFAKARADQPQGRAF
jgi:murein DD-endopeptidase MepM/ murein hydrolase activator NlpD